MTPVTRKAISRSIG